MKKTIIKTTIIAVIFNLVLFNLSFALKAPDTLEEAGELGKKTLEVAQTKLPGALKNVWQEDVIPVWQKMDDWFKRNFWQKIEEEIKKRKAIIGEDFKNKFLFRNSSNSEINKGKEEFKKEAPQLGKNLQVFILEFFKSSFPSEKSEGRIRNK
ncbi:hypothetical protein KJ636_04270 [Patescibacteria group bacterium]|nr:hypothetical protein [Patescibacteria group bacterium]MBU4481472.1 hypothetical protein [Patescibacteria group bacterium]